MDSYLLDLIYVYTRKKGYYLEKSELALQLLSHPDYLTIKSITDTFNYFNVENLAIKTPKENLDKLPKVFLVGINDHNSNGFALAEIRNNEVLLRFSNVESRIVSREIFLTIWSGIIVVIEEASKKNIIKRVNNPLKKIIVISVFLISVVYVAIRFNDNYLTLFFSMGLLGLAICVLILRKEMGYNSIFTEKLCSLNTNKDCTNVINSKGSYLFKDIKLSDVGLIYFSALILFIFWTDFNLNQVFSFLLLISSGGLLFSVYSFFYQWRVVKKWCSLCLFTVSILIIQFNISFFFGPVLELNYFILIEFLFLVITLSVFWYFLKSILKTNSRVNEIKIKNLKFNRDYRLFSSYYIDIQRLSTSSDRIFDIVLGNNESDFEVLVVTNPLCETCIKMHEILKSILLKHSQNLSIRLRFYVPFNNRDDIRTKISERLLELFHNESPSFSKQALEEWYKDLGENWIKKYGYNSNKYFNDILKSHMEWCSKNNVETTPTVFINGKKIPDIYELNSLQNFIEEIMNINLKVA